VLECQDLPIVNGQCDPYAAVSLQGPSRSEAKKTKVKRKTNNPQYDEVFYFEITRPLSYTKRQFDVEEEDVDKLALRVDLWNASNLKFGDEFLGGVRVPLKVLGQEGIHDAWYFLQPRDNCSKSVKADELGSLRLNIVYTEDHVFPSESYSDLTDLLLQSANMEPVSASAAHILGEVCREKQEAAVPLVRLFLHFGKIVPFVSAIANAEVNRTQDPNTIFRGNSLTSKCIDETMKLAGMHYLQVTLKPIIDEVRLSLAL
ncbi:ras GTPase-activating protein 3, partial [Tachysurus ichikawai]